MSPCGCKGCFRWCHCQEFADCCKKCCLVIISSTCGKPGAVPRKTVKVIAILSTILGIFETALGVWLTTITILNSTLPLKYQMYFRQITPYSGGSFFMNENLFTQIPVNNLSFYLYSMSLIAILAGIGRIIMSILLYIYIKKGSNSDSVFYGWSIITILSLASLFIISFDTLKTLGMNDSAPLQMQDFEFTNDVYGFYFLCYVFKWGILADVIVTLYFQIVVRLHFYKPRISSATISAASP